MKIRAELSVLGEGGVLWLFLLLLFLFLDRDDEGREMGAWLCVVGGSRDDDAGCVVVVWMRVSC